MSSSSSYRTHSRAANTVDNCVQREDVIKYANMGTKLENCDASRLVLVENPRIQISRLDVRNHSESRIGWGAGTYPSNWEVGPPGGRPLMFANQSTRFFEGCCTNVLADNFDESIWHRDTLGEAHHDDALWGFAVRAAEEFRLHSPQQWNDPVLHRLFLMGTRDWTNPDKRQPQATQGIRFATVMGSRLLPRILAIEGMVCRSRFEDLQRLIVIFDVDLGCFGRR
jgi:hypothetical protein